MFLKRAMRYYRVWIYSCNLALFTSTLVFIILSLWIASDFHLSLFPSITFYQPSFIYAYMALTLQSGILQAIGCMGANRMNERLLGLYWQILLVLLIGDIVVGIIWLFRYNLLLTNLRSDLIYRLDNDYGFDTDFQELWDRVQSEHQCCGIDTPYDYNVTQWFEREHATYEGAQFLVPQSCCAYHQFPLIPTIDGSRGVDEILGVATNSNNNGIGISNSAIIDGGGGTINKESAINSNSPSLQDSDQGGGGGGGRGLRGGGGGNSFLGPSRTTSADCMDSYRPENIYTTGCYTQILEWLQSSVDCLSVIGFCVITFLKLCFAFILRYEIREMIQKINLIKGDKERNDSTTLHNLEAYLPRPSIQPDQPLLSTQSPHSQQSNNTNQTTTNINIDTNSNGSGYNGNNSNNVINTNSVSNTSTITANKRNRFSTTNQQPSFNSSIGSYGTASFYGDTTTTINIPSRHSPQSIGGYNFSSSLATSPPTKRLIISPSFVTIPTTTPPPPPPPPPTIITKSPSNQQSTIVSTTTITTCSPISPATLITTVTNSSPGTATTILPPSTESVNSAQFLGLISIPMSGSVGVGGGGGGGDNHKSNKSKSFNNSNNGNNNNNQVLVTTNF